MLFFNITKILYLLIFIVIIIIIFDFIQIKENFIQQMIKDANKEISTKKQNWLEYKAYKKNNIYLLTDTDDNIIYKMKITKNNNKSIYTTNDKNNISTGTIMTKHDNTFNASGKFEKYNAKTNFSQNNERIKISLNNQEINIIGYGGFSDNTSYPTPLHQVIPIVYKEGNSLIATMDLFDDIKNNIMNNILNLPYKINILKEYQKYLPLLFQIYVFSQEYISYLL